MIIFPAKMPSMTAWIPSLATYIPPMAPTLLPGDKAPFEAWSITWNWSSRLNPDVPVY